MNSIMVYKKMCHEFQNKLNRELTVKEYDFIKWIVNQKFEKEDFQGIIHTLISTSIQ